MSSRPEPSRPNSYSPTWFETFLLGGDPARSEREVAFLRGLLPLPAHRSVLDVCCGPGRHAAPLARAGYRVIGVDADAEMIRLGNASAPEGLELRVGDMRELSPRPESFDAAICMWQSFGHFDDRTNARVLADLARCVRPGGRVVLDVYHRAFHAPRVGVRQIRCAGRSVVERSAMTGGRLRVELTYDGPESDEAFEWRLYTPGELAELGHEAGLDTVAAYTGFDSSRAATPDEPRIQMLWTRR